MTILAAHPSRDPAGSLQWAFVMAVLASLLLSCGGPAQAAAAPDPAPAAAAAAAGGTAPGIGIRPVDDAWRASLPRDAEAATRAYLDRLSPEAVARSNAYFEGGYWLQLWNLLAGLAVSWLLMARLRSARLAVWCLRAARARLPADALYGAAFGLVSFVLTLPLTIYQGYFREHQYGMATQTFGPWFAEQLIGLVVSMLLLAVITASFYAMRRRAGDLWWAWGAALGSALLTVLVLISPLVIDPLFNTYRPLEDGTVKSAVLAMAHANGVPVDNVYWFDASRQTTRVSANVSGIFGSAAVRLNDNLLKRSSLPEIRMVMAHELGHYVLNHIYKSIALFALLLLAGCALLRWLLQGVLARHGASLGVADDADVAGFPLLAALFLVLSFLATPVTNTLVRVQEIEADRFGLDLSREPHGAAEAFLKLTEYRKPAPGPWEEFIFYDHPSTRFRIYDAMRWREAMGTP